MNELRGNINQEAGRIERNSLRAKQDIQNAIYCILIIILIKIITL